MRSCKPIGGLKPFLFSRWSSEWDSRLMRTTHTETRAPRVDVELPVELRFFDSGEVFLAISVNVSETGMLILSEESRPRGTLAHFEFRPDLNGTGEVIWTKGAEDGGAYLGIRFRALKRGARDSLRQLVQQTSP